MEKGTKEVRIARIRTIVKNAIESINALYHIYLNDIKHYSPILNEDIKRFIEFQDEHDRNGQLEIPAQQFRQ